MGQPGGLRRTSLMLVSPQGFAQDFFGGCEGSSMNCIDGVWPLVVDVMLLFFCLEFILCSSSESAIR
jgi:hypothetical protein